MRSLATSITRGFISLLTPPSCFGCFSGNEWVCSDCSTSLRPRPVFLREAGESVVTCIAYDERTARIVLAAKEIGNSHARHILSSALASALKELIRGRDPNTPIGIVCIPSSRRSKSRRGRDSLAGLARDALRLLELDSQAGRIPELQLLDILRWRRQVRDQSRLNEHERNENLRDALEVVTMPADQIPIVVIDDVITTGSTLVAAFRALRERKLTIVGAATACASMRRMPIR